MVSSLRWTTEGFLAARLSRTTCRNQQSSWFQLAKVWLTTNLLELATAYEPDFADRTQESNRDVPSSLTDIAVSLRRTTATC
jgi:hypothetical protein